MHNTETPIKANDRIRIPTGAAEGLAKWLTGEEGREGIRAEVVAAVVVVEAEGDAGHGYCGRVMLTNLWLIIIIF